jgi:glycosyltransferase involved in cell wall biosynthesis
MTSKRKRAPELSVVIPVFNEEAILEVAVRSLLAKLAKTPWTHELILAENGSTDRTLAIAESLHAELPGLIVLHEPQPNYGRALRRGIERASGRFVVCDEIDLGHMDFYCNAMEVLGAGADMVIGSKRHKDSRDDRPWLRRRATATINALLRVAVGFTGSDTHGLKAFRRRRLLPVVALCKVEHDLFASELVIRAMRSGLDVREIPLSLREIRPPSVGLFRRVPRVLGNLAKLVVVIRWPDGK